MNKLKIVMLFSILTLVTLSSCKVFQVPKSNPAAIALKTEVQAETASLFAAIANSTNKSYAQFAAQYASINVKMSNITSLDSTRKNSATLLELDWIAIDRFHKYEEQHKAGPLNTSQATVNKLEMNAAWKPPFNSEINYNPKGASRKR